MTNEEKQALIKWLKEGIACSEEYGFNGNILKSMQIALAALTAQPVKLPQAWASDNGNDLLDKDRVISAIRAAGYEVQE
ncbi:hypothetical protein AB9Q52_010995 [Pantoea vagans]|uniref:hypothetical protein n=1 Tax=Pantoea vagans TaxID=470934 RepID=UPI003515B30F